MDQNQERKVEILRRLNQIDLDKASYKKDTEEIEKRGKDKPGDNAAQQADIAALQGIKDKLDTLATEETTLRNELNSLNQTPGNMQKTNMPDKKERKDTMITFEEKRASKAYEIVFAKYYLNKRMTEEEMNLFCEVNPNYQKRAEGVAVTTTDADYVAPSSGADGINNGGVFVPETVRLDVLNELERISPFFAKIRKLAVMGSINFPYKDTQSEAKWYAEGTVTEDNSIKFATLALNGYELADYIKITWKLEAMAVSGFLPFIRTELVRNCGRALIKAVIYGRGSTYNEPTGATVGALKVTSTGYASDGLLAEIEGMPTKLLTGRKDASIGAEYFVAPDVVNSICFAKDANGRYLFNPLTPPTQFGVYKLNIDPFLNAGDMLFGDSFNYILNEQIPMGTLKESEAKYRRTGYSAYGVYDGKPIPSTFVYGFKHA